MKDRIGTDGLSGLERIYKPAGTDLQVIEISGEPPRSGVEPRDLALKRLATTPPYLSTKETGYECSV